MRKLLDGMEQELTAKKPTPWLQFILKYTYPQPIVDQGLALEKEQSRLSCLFKEATFL